MKKIVLALLMAGTLVQAQKRKTEVSIQGGDFYINQKITLKGKVYQGMKLEGLLPNSRMVQGIYDDLNPETRILWKYPDTGTWDADRNTNEFIKAMPTWKNHGLLAITLNLQGGSPQGYSKDQPWINTAFKSDGSLDEVYTKRLEKILDKADQLGMVVILGYFYFGQDERLNDEAAVVNAVKNATDWLLDKNYRNVLVEVNNESNINKYDHAILKENRIHELISLVKSRQRDGRRLLVSTSFGGGFIPVDNVLAVNDFVLVHGNGVKDPARIEQMVKTIREKSSYGGQPIVFNEDDHFDFDKPYNNFIAATKAGASWGYFDYRMKDEGFVEGYQSIPADWSINSERKKGFFGLLKKMTK
ncbi:hypothetical protein [Salmonirosea aquatica]|uniref:Cellulase family glycosylhydrolase n=1 Tax=Salmonirosea aquatica TaxID=2654236 RepID=A0A7C9FES6_9BACT|nr:hypothetical protein [Cytophagaceae bacterium SJW1-29]